MRGALLVFEGLDRAGKSTQCERLAQKLEKEGRRVKRMRFPDRTTLIGKSIDAYLKGVVEQEDHVIHLLFSANRWEAVAGMKKNIADGKVIVVDRYYYSGMVYSAAKDNPDLTIDWARGPELGLPKPDVCIFLDISPDKAAQRGGYGLEKYESSKMQKRVRELFDEIRLLPGEDNIYMIDAGQSVEKVEEEVYMLVKKTFDKIEQGQEALGSLAVNVHTSS